MNKRNLLLLGFAVVVAAQLAVPAWMIIERELTLREGKVFKFKTRPVDPADAFRGRYVWLGLEPDKVKVPDANRWETDRPWRNGKAFAVLGTNAEGFVVVERLQREAPAGVCAVPVQVGWCDVKNGEVHIAWPGLDQFFMAEDKAPAADAAYVEHNRRGNRNGRTNQTERTCYVTIRVRGSCAVLENLYLEDQPVHEWLKQHPAGK